MTSLERDDGVVAIRPYRESDDVRLLAAARESIETVGRWLPWCHAGYEIRDARDWIATTREQIKSGDGYHLAVVALDAEPAAAIDGPGAVLGGVGLGPLVRVHGIANLGYWMRASACGLGLCTRAVRLLAPLGFELGLTRLEIVAAVDNAASLRVAEKVGAVREGVLRNRIKVGGELHDAVGYSLVPGDLR